MAGKILGRCIAAVALALIGQEIGACGGDDDGEGGGSNVDCATVTLTYANYGQALINQHCIACHAATPIGNTIRLDTLAAVKAETPGILARAVDLTAEPTMPYLLPTLPPAEREKLGQWLECGAPP